MIVLIAHANGMDFGMVPVGLATHRFACLHAKSIDTTCQQQHLYHCICSVQHVTMPWEHACAHSFDVKL